MVPEDGAQQAAAATAEHPAVSEVDSFRCQVDDLACKTDVLERRVNEVVGFYDGKKHGSGGRRASGSSRYAANGARDSNCKGMPDLMRQLTGIIRQITFHEWSAPFLQPVDVVGLQLDDYHKIITKPMDFSTIQNKMEAKDGTKYRSVREIYSDVRLIFTNAMTYNDEHHDVHIMAKLLLEKFEEKWLQLLPKVENEERKQQVEPNDAPTTDTSPEDAIAKLAKDTDDELNEINKQLEMLRNMVVQRCRKMTTDEKRKLGAGLCHLTPEDLSKALELVAQDNPNFQTTAEEVDLDMDAQSETTLWRLKFFVREALERQANTAAAPGKTDENAKRKRDIYNALAKTASKRIRR
ncbi:Transcription factor GTE1 [Triticum urartu]|uniref:Transcription factor GTE1 n=1 Tax=Triticum urartu TaxID=4572 RepID=M8B371_TRIUA|nr:transcription factor GTE1-like [Triticum urartu]EMS68004.1 Transcription factor GTE1 [Triticum urartu]